VTTAAIWISREAGLVTAVSPSPGTPRSSTRSPRTGAWSRSTTPASAPRPAGRRTLSKQWPATQSPSSRPWTFSRWICSASRSAASSRERSRSSDPTYCDASCSHPPHRKPTGLV